MHVLSLMLAGLLLCCLHVNGNMMEISLADNYLQSAESITTTEITARWCTVWRNAFWQVSQMVQVWVLTFGYFESVLRWTPRAELGIRANHFSCKSTITCEVAAPLHLLWRLVSSGPAKGWEWRSRYQLRTQIAFVIRALPLGWLHVCPNVCWRYQASGLS